MSVSIKSNGSSVKVPKDGAGCLYFTDRSKDPVDVEEYIPYGVCDGVVHTYDSSYDTQSNRYIIDKEEGSIIFLYRWDADDRAIYKYTGEVMNWSIWCDDFPPIYYANDIRLISDLNGGVYLKSKRTGSSIYRSYFCRIDSKGNILYTDYKDYTSSSLVVDHRGEIIPISNTKFLEFTDTSVLLCDADTGEVLETVSSNGRVFMSNVLVVNSYLYGISHYDGSTNLRKFDYEGNIINTYSIPVYGIGGNYRDKQYFRVDTNGDIYIISNNSKLMKYTNDGELVFELTHTDGVGRTGNFNTSTGLTIDDTGIYVAGSEYCDPDCSLIFSYKYDKEGNLVWRSPFMNRTQAMIQIEVDKYYNIYFREGNYADYRGDYRISKMPQSPKVKFKEV